MDEHEGEHEPRGAKRVLGRAMRLRCPVCGEGQLFRGLTAHTHCPHCGFRFEREDGYWSNAVAANYMLTGTVSTLVIAPVAFTSSLPLVPLLLAAVVFAMGLAFACYWHVKALWLALDLIVRPPTTSERLHGFLHTVRAPAEVIADKYRE